MLHANLLALSFIEPELFAIEVYIAGIGISTVLLLCLWPGPEDLHIGTARVLQSLQIHRMCKYKIPMSRLSKVIVWQTYRHTDKLGVVTSGHLTKMAVTPFDPPYLKTQRCKPDGSTFYRTGVMGDQSLHYRKNKFPPFLLLWPWRWPLPNELYIQTWSVFPGDTPDVQIWTSYVKAFESYRLTDIQRQVTGGHFRSRDKEGEHNIRSAVFKNPMLHANLMALSVTEPELWAIEVFYIAAFWTFSTFLM